MRRALLPLAAACLAAVGVRAAGVDVLAPVTPDRVVAAVAECAAAQSTGDVKTFACYKPGGAVTADTFAQAAVDLQFREIDKRILQYLETLKRANTAQPVEFAHSILTCFDPDFTGTPYPACADMPAGGSPRNFATSYAAACARSADLVVTAIGLWNQRNWTSLPVASDGHIAAILSGENRTDGKASCTGIASRKLAAFRRVADMLARQALQAGYDQARQAFVSKVSTQYAALLDKLQRMTSKLDLVNDKWNQRTKNVYNP